MAADSNVKKIHRKSKKSRGNKINLVFDEEKRREFLTGFRKRKLQRKLDAKEKLERDLKEERKRLKTEARGAYKKLVVSHQRIPELEFLLKEEYEENDTTVRIEEFSTNKIAVDNNWMGTNQPMYKSDTDDEVEEENMPGMSLRETTETKGKSKNKFQSERELKRSLKKAATKRMKKSKVFHMKNKVEKRKQKKRSIQVKKRLKVKDKRCQKVR